MTRDVLLPRRPDVPAAFITQAVSASASTGLPQLTRFFQVHPALGTPFWHVHPCETSQAMAVPMQLTPEPATANYVAIWLTLYAVPLGLSMNTRLFFQ